MKMPWNNDYPVPTSQLYVVMVLTMIAYITLNMLLNFVIDMNACVSINWEYTALYLALAVMILWVVFDE